MKSDRLRTSCVLPLLGLLALCSLSCSSITNIVVAQDVGTRGSEIKIKIPLRAGLYLSPFVQRAKRFYWFGIRNQGTIFLGEALSANANGIMRNVFQDVIVIDTMESNLDRCDVIVTPILSEIYMRGILSWTGPPNDFIFHVAIKWVIATPDGREIYANLIKSEEVKLSASDEAKKQGFVQTLRSQFELAQEDIYTNGWWRTQWWKTSN